MSKPRGFAYIPLIAIIVAVAAVSVMLYFTFTTGTEQETTEEPGTTATTNTNATVNVNSATNVNTAHPVCVDMEPKRCPDGTETYRQLPNCDYAPCPSGTGVNVNVGINANIAASSSKTCRSDSDCGLLICAGCFSKTYLQTAPPDLACRQYEGYSCQCIAGGCTAVKNSESNLNVNAGAAANTNSAATAGWKTYTNDTYGYSIQYPEAYILQTATPNGQKNILFEKGESGHLGYNFITVGILQANDTDSANNNMFIWAKKGFPKNDPITAYHSNPREVTLGNEAFVLTDGDTGSSGIPEYLIFHNNMLYVLASYSGGGSQDSNKAVIATFVFND